MIRQKPFVIEFTGTPEAGKSTVILLLKEALVQIGYKTKIYHESAETAHMLFSKNSLASKLWMTLDTAAHVLEARTLLDYDIVLFDRGMLDRAFWLDLDRIYMPQAAEKCELIINSMQEYSPDLLIALTVTTEECIRRRGGEGRVVTRQFIDVYNHLLKVFVDSLRINKVIISTDNKPIEEVVQTVKNSILEHFKSHS